MTSTTTRIPADVVVEARAYAAAHGISVGEAIAIAWRSYFADNRDEVANRMEQAAELLRSGDTEALAAHLNQGVEARAIAAAERD